MACFESQASLWKMPNLNQNKLSSSIPPINLLSTNLLGFIVSKCSKLYTFYYCTWRTWKSSILCTKVLKTSIVYIQLIIVCIEFTKKKSLYIKKEAKKHTIDIFWILNIYNSAFQILPHTIIECVKFYMFENNKPKIKRLVIQKMKILNKNK